MENVDKEDEGKLRRSQYLKEGPEDSSTPSKRSRDIDLFLASYDSDVLNKIVKILESRKEFKLRNSKSMEKTETYTCLSPASVTETDNLQR
jgi:hypothetical protein